MTHHCIDGYLLLNHPKETGQSNGCQECSQPNDLIDRNCPSRELLSCTQTRLYLELKGERHALK